jgi:hypothetical protein
MKAELDEIIKERTMLQDENRNFLNQRDLTNKTITTLELNNNNLKTENQRLLE